MCFIHRAGAAGLFSFILRIKTNRMRTLYITAQSIRTNKKVYSNLKKKILPLFKCLYTALNTVQKTLSKEKNATHKPFP